MKKIALDVHDLRVDSFRTTAAPAASRVVGDPETWEDVLTCGGGCDGAPDSAGCIF